MRLLPLVALAALLAGCGGGIGEDAYVARVTKASETVGQAMQGVTRDSVKLDAGSKAIVHVADDLDGLHPPGKLDHLNAQIVSGFRAIAGSFHQAAVAARSGDFKKRDDILDHLEKSRGMRDINGAIAEIDRLES
jgi:hypothetical protein